MTLLAAALNYAARGYPVFPLHSARAGACTCGDANCTSPAKHPRTRSGLKDATIDPDTIRAWWTAMPDSNIGLVTGAASGVAIIDIDPRHGGDASLRALQTLHGNFPTTPTARTGGGGQHIVFQHPGQPTKNRANIAPGIDVRADGGYIVAPPSTHASGSRYEWTTPIDAALAPLPGFLLTLINGPNAPHRGPAPQIEAAFTTGQRNAALASLAGSMRNKGIGPEAIEAALLAENQRRCTPPLPDGEVRNIARSISRYEPGNKALRDPRNIALVERLLHEVRRVEVTKGTETRYRITVDHEGATEIIELTDAQLAEGPKAFKTRYLALFGELVTFPQGGYVEFVNGLLGLDTVIHMEEREQVDEEALAVEGFKERAQRWKVTRDLQRSVREEDLMYLEPETGMLLVRSERVNRFLRSTGHKVTVNRFGHLLRQGGVVRQTSFQKWVPPKDEGGKGQTLYFWRLDPTTIGVTSADFQSEPPAGHPADPAVNGGTVGEEGAAL